MDDYCIIGGGTLEALGIRETNDIDLCVPSNILEKLKNNNTCQSTKKMEGICIYQIDERIEIKENYYKRIGFSDDEIINNTKYYFFEKGIKFVRPELVYVTKLMRNAPHDQKDIKLIDKYTLSISDNKFDLDMVSQLNKTAKKGQIKIFILKVYIY